MFKALRELFKIGNKKKQKKEASVVTVDVFSVITASFFL